MQTAGSGLVGRAASICNLNGAGTNWPARAFVLYPVFNQTGEGKWKKKKKKKKKEGKRVQV